jgi:hypothetical protein
MSGDGDGDRGVHVQRSGLSAQSALAGVLGPESGIATMLLWGGSTPWSGLALVIHCLDLWPGGSATLS